MTLLLAFDIYMQGFPERRILRLRLPKTCLGAKKKSFASVGTLKKCEVMNNNYILRIVAYEE